VREFIRRLEAAGLTVEPTPGHYRVLRDGKPLRKANGMPLTLPFSPDVAALVDATIVRAVLLPATMKLLGDWNWYLPTGSNGSPSSNVPSDDPKNNSSSPSNQSLKTESSTVRPADGGPHDVPAAHNRDNRPSRRNPNPEAKLVEEEP
jgi:hypothetical protein